MVRPIIRIAFVAGSVVGVLVGGIALLRRAAPSLGDETSDEIRLSAIAEPRALASRAQAFRGGSILGVMGATHLDLRNATVGGSGAHLQVQAAMSAVKILVPDSWTVDARGLVASSSAVENRAASTDEDGTALAQLTLSGRLVASALAISHGESEQEEAAVLGATSDATAPVALSAG